MSEETIPQMRERIETLEKENKSLTGKVSASEGKARLFEARDAFREAGYKPEYAELFVGNHEGEITPDAIGGFASKYGFNPVTGETMEPTAEGQGGTAEEAGQEAQSKSNLAAMSRAGSRAGDGGAASPGNDPMTRDAYNELYKTDPAAARKAIKEGRVQIRKDNPYAQN